MSVGDPGEEMATVWPDRSAIVAMLCRATSTQSSVAQATATMRTGAPCSFACAAATGVAIAKSSARPPWPG